MTPQSQPAANSGEPRSRELVAVPQELLTHISGGLPYHGFSVPPILAAESPSTDLPYHGF